MPRYKIQRKFIISYEETKDLVDKLADPRDKSMAAMFFLCGCRPSELKLIVKQDFNISAHENKLWINLTTKKKPHRHSELIISNRWNWAYLDDPMAKIVLEYIENKDMTEPLWDYGNTAKSHNKNIDRRLKAINPNVCAYVFRKSKVTRLMNAGNDYGYIVSWFGWADDRVLQRYNVGTKKTTENIDQDRSDNIKPGY